MKLLDIALVAQRSGVPASTLRFYEEKGLIASAGRRGLRRLFDSRVLERLAVIALGRAAGFSLEEISQSLLPDGGFRIERARLTAKARELDRTIQRLTAIRDDLRHAAACPAPTHMECPNFQRFVQLAGAGRLDPHERKLSRPSVGRGDSHWTASAAQPELKRRRRINPTG